MHTMQTRGMTMIEVLVWIAVFTAAMLAITSSLLAFYRANSYALEQSQAVNSAQHAIDDAVKTLREAAFSSQGAYPILSMSANSITLYADTDTDALVEQVRYALSGTNLIRGIVDPAGDPPAYTGAESVSTVASSIRNLERGIALFHYYDASGAEITDYSQIGDVRFITVQVVVNVDVVKLPNELTLQSSAALRNIINQ